MTTLDDIIRLTTRVQRLEAENRALRGVLDQHLEILEKLQKLTDLLTGKVEMLAARRVPPAPTLGPTRYR